MNVIPIQNVWFDDAATLAMGEAFDRACRSLRNLGSAVPEIIANVIIQAAKTGECDPARLRYLVPSRPSATFCRCRSWAGCTTNMSGFSF